MKGGWRLSRLPAWIVLGLLGLVLAPGWFGAHAATCEGNKTLVTLPSIKAPADAAVGSVLWSRNGIPFDTYCTVAWIDTYSINLWREDLHTALQSYGLEFRLTYGGNSGSNAQQIASPMVVDLAGNPGNAKGTVDLALVKTGTTPAHGIVTTGDILAFSLDSNTNNHKGSHYIRGLNNIQFVAYSCSLDSNSRTVSVPLGDIRRDRFSGVGSTSPAKDFNIGLTCSQPADNYTMSITFSATQDASQKPGVLALTPGTNAATGVGIQLQAKGTPVEFAKAIEIGRDNASTLSVPMSARYYQTAAAIKPGTANGIATFVVTYK